MEAALLVEGQTLLRGGRYRFLRRIGSGTFAVILWCVLRSLRRRPPRALTPAVHSALDLRSDRLVAIKSVQGAEFRAVAEREASVLRHVNARDPAGSCAGASPSPAAPPAERTPD